jgi:uncharacterized protein YecE (DUF72 family)
VSQLEMFDGGPRVAAAPFAAGHRELARRIPASVHLGTSSWSFPGWVGIVYGRRASARLLAREGLVPYARHPLLRCVGVDRSYYGGLPASVFSTYAAQVPGGFRFVVKAPEACTLGRYPLHERYGASAGERNPLFLDPAFAIETFVAPTLEGLGARAGALVFQFPPQPADGDTAPEAFAERLAGFLGALPAEGLYAVEVRNRRWLTRAYAEALAATGACHCLTVHPSMPALAEQARIARVERGPALVARWMLGGGRRYDEARERYAPFDRLVDEDLPTRTDLATRCAAAARDGRPVFVTVNNKAEGSAPLSVFRLAEAIASAC